MRSISVITGCFNEEGNVTEVYMRVREAIREGRRLPYARFLSSHRRRCYRHCGRHAGPPEMIVEMIHKWEEGYSVVIGIKEAAEEHPVMFWIRRRHYKLVNRLSGIDTIENFTGFGRYNRKVVNIIKQFDRIRIFAG